MTCHIFRTKQKERKEIKLIKILFKDIPGFENEYQATTDGKIWSLKTKRFLSQHLRGQAGKKYYYVCLCKNNIPQNFRVHRLVAMTFISNPDNLPCVNHKDYNKLNNKVTNLEWCSYKENNEYGNRIEKSVETRKKNGYCIKTAVYNKNTNELIGEFESIRDAIRFLGLPKSADSNISEVINGRKKSAYGYYWKRL